MHADKVLTPDGVMNKQTNMPLLLLLFFLFYHFMLSSGNFTYEPSRIITSLATRYGLGVLDNPRKFLWLENSAWDLLGLNLGPVIFGCLFEA